MRFSSMINHMLPIHGQLALDQEMFMFLLKQLQQLKDKLFIPKCGLAANRKPWVESAIDWSDKTILLQRIVFLAAFTNRLMSLEVSSASPEENFL